MEITGKIHLVAEIEQVSPTFRKRQVVIEYAENPMYPQFVAFQLIQDKVNLIDSYTIGDMVSISFNLRGRAWNSPTGEAKFFNTLDIWRIAPAGDAQNVQQAPQGNEEPAIAIDVTNMSDEEDLPF